MRFEEIAFLHPQNERWSVSIASGSTSIHLAVGVPGKANVGFTGWEQRDKPVRPVKNEVALWRIERAIRVLGTFEKTHYADRSGRTSCHC